MKTKKLLSLVLCLLMVFGTMSVMTASAAETTVYEVKNATELNNAIKIAAPNSAIRLIANITAEETFAVIKNKESFTIDLNGFSIKGESETIYNFITVGDNTTLFIINTKSNNNASSIMVNSKKGGTSVLCLNGENAALHILDGVEIAMGTNGYYACNRNYAHCIKVIEGKELNVNGADIYNWMYWGRCIIFDNSVNDAFDDFTFKVNSDSEITAKVACIDFSFANSLPGKSYVKDCKLSYETSLPYFDDGEDAVSKKDFMAIKAATIDDFVLVDVLAEGYIAEYTNIGAYVDNQTLIKNFPKGVDVFVDECYDHDCKDIIKTVKRTCTEDGYTVYECPACYGTKTLTLPAQGHSYYTGFEKVATCGKNGEKAIKCSVCGDQPEVEILPATGNHNYVVTASKAPTCVEAGYKEYNCSTCGGTKKDTIAATGVHSFDGSECTVCDYDAADDCDCNCHAGGIKAFFFKFINFFQKHFGQNKVCSCGARH